MLEIAAQKEDIDDSGSESERPEPQDDEDEGLDFELIPKMNRKSGKAVKSKPVVEDSDENEAGPSHIKSSKSKSKAKGKGKGKAKANADDADAEEDAPPKTKGKAKVIDVDNDGDASPSEAPPAKPKAKRVYKKKSAPKAPVVEDSDIEMLDSLPTATTVPAAAAPAAVPFAPPHAPASPGVGDKRTRIDSPQRALSPTSNPAPKRVAAEMNQSEQMQLDESGPGPAPPSAVSTLLADHFARTALEPAAGPGPSFAGSSTFAPHTSPTPVVGPGPSFTPPSSFPLPPTRSKTETSASVSSTCQVSQMLAEFPTDDDLRDDPQRASGSRVQLGHIPTSPSGSDLTPLNSRSPSQSRVRPFAEDAAPGEYL